MKKRRNVKRKKKSKINIKAIILPLLLIGLIIYIIYFLMLFFGIETVDSVAENIASYTILSQEKGDVEKTMFLFEKEVEDLRRISDIYVFLQNKNRGISLLIYVPGSMYFEGLEEEFGNPISISSLRYAGDFLQEDRGVEYALWQLSEILGFKVQNYIWVTTEAYEKILEIYDEPMLLKEKDKLAYHPSVNKELTDSFFHLSAFSSNISGLDTFLKIRQVKELDGQIFSNLSFFNVMQRISSFKKEVENTEAYALDISRPNFSTEKFSENGGVVSSINVKEYDKVLRNYVFKMIDKELEKERVRVEVYNGTDVAGRALIYSRKIQNSGCDVVRFGNAPVGHERTQIYISDKNQFKNSLKVISDVLLGRFEMLEERPSFMTTGDIVIILGDDIAHTEIF